MEGKPDMIGKLLEELNMLDERHARRAWRRAWPATFPGGPGGVRQHASLGGGHVTFAPEHVTFAPEHTSFAPEHTSFGPLPGAIPAKHPRQAYKTAIQNPTQP